MIRAAIDVGSNSVLLSVAERSADGRWRSILETSEVTGLGRGVEATGHLTPEGIAATLDALERAWKRAEEAGATEIRAAGTMALRRAANAADFLDAARSRGCPVRVLSGEEEAELGFHAVADDPLFASEPRLTIVDPGGHSTEVVTAERRGRGWSVAFRKSWPLGALTLRESLLPDPKPPVAARLTAVEAIDRLIDLEYAFGQAGRVVSLGATGVNLVSIRERLDRFDPARIHGQILLYEEVSRAVGWMFDMDDEERARIPGIEKGRETTLHLGALILERFLYALRAEECVVSTRGWRHALLEQDDSEKIDSASP